MTAIFGYEALLTLNDPRNPGNTVTFPLPLKQADLTTLDIGAILDVVGALQRAGLW